MRYRRLGNSGLKVSEIALGGWLTLGGSVAEKDSVNLILKAAEHGINLFDMADVYSAGQSEVMLGKALKELPREQMVVATKVRGKMHDGPFGAGLSKKHIMQACEASLRRLGTDYIDLYQFHAPDADVTLEESLEALDVLRYQGKILYAGVSNFKNDEILTAVSISETYHFPRIVSSQPRYNMLQREFEKEVAPACELKGIGNIIYSPLAQGILTGKYRAKGDYPADSRAFSPSGRWMQELLTQDNTYVILDRLRAVAAEAGMSLVQMSLLWNLRHPVVTANIVGATKPVHVDDAVSAMEHPPLDHDTLTSIERALAS